MVFKEEAYREVFPKQVERPIVTKKESMINDEPEEVQEEVKQTESVIIEEKMIPEEPVPEHQEEGQE